MNAIFLHLEAKQSFKNDGQKYEALLTNQVEKHLAVTCVNSVPMGDGGFQGLYVGGRKRTVTVRLYLAGVVTIKIEEIGKAGEQLSSSSYESFIKEMAKVLDCQQHDSFSIVKPEDEQRCSIKTNHRIMTKWDAEKVLFDEESPFQRVQVLQTHLGKLFVLDGGMHCMVNDAVYPSYLMQRGKEDYYGKEVLLLGCGVGIILREILKEKPKLVVAVEIDEVVIRAGRTCVREENGGILDALKGANYEIFVDDCLNYLEKADKEGRKFDYVISSLSESPLAEDQQPISADQSSSISSALKNVINRSFKVLRPSGKYFCHCTESANLHLIQKLENELLNTDEPLTFTSSEGFIPTVMRFWKFYQIWRKHP